MHSERRREQRLDKPEATIILVNDENLFGLPDSKNVSYIYIYNVFVCLLFFFKLLLGTISTK